MTSWKWCNPVDAVNGKLRRWYTYKVSGGCFQVCEAGEGLLCEMLGGGVPPGLWNPYLLILEGHIHTAYRWEYDSWALKCWHSRVSINIILLRICRQFCIIDVWQSLIRVVVLHLLSRCKNFDSNKHRRHFTQDGLVSLRKVRTTLGRTNHFSLCADQFESSTSPPRATPRAFELLKIGLFKFPPLGAKKPFKCPTN